MPTATYIPLATITLSSTDSIIEFASIPNTYRDLVLVYTGNASGTNADTMLYFNSDTTNGNYSTVVMAGDGTNAGSNTFLSAGAIHTGGRDTHIIRIFDYSATDKHKTALISNDNANNNTNRRAWRWANTAAINNVSFRTQSQSWAIGSTFSLYGIAG